MWLPRLPAVAVAAFAWIAAAAVDDPDIKSISLRTHTLEKPYLDSDMQSRWFDFGGDTIIRTDSYIRLTSDRPSQNGWLFSRVPLTATNWEIEVEFRIHGKNNLFGDGLAMWLTRERGQLGNVFGSTDNFEGLGIFIDTYKNNRPGVIFPYVMAMLGDGKTPYDKANDGKANELAGCSARGIRHGAVQTRLRLTYFQDRQLKLELQYKPDEWTTCFDVSDPPAIPNVAYLGFSAETGELSDNHDIISVTTKNLYKTGEASAGGGGGKGSGRGAGGRSGGSSGGRVSAGQGEGGSWTWFFTKIFLFVLVAGVGYVGFTAWRTKTKSHRF